MPFISTKPAPPGPVASALQTLAVERRAAAREAYAEALAADSVNVAAVLDVLPATGFAAADADADRESLRALPALRVAAAEIARIEAEITEAKRSIGPLRLHLTEHADGISATEHKRAELRIARLVAARADALVAAATARDACAAADRRFGDGAESVVTAAALSRKIGAATLAASKARGWAAGDCELIAKAEWPRVARGAPAAFIRPDVRAALAGAWAKGKT